MNFLGLAPEDGAPERCRYHILPVPYDGTSTWNKGADKGPAALLAASAQVEYYDIETDSEPCRHGIYTGMARLDVSSPEKMVGSVQGAVSKIYGRAAFPIVIGGEHSVSIGAIRAAAAAHPDLSVLQLDAHADLRETYHGSPYNHACVMARVRELCPIVQVGIRSADREELESASRERVFFAHDIAGSFDWIPRALALLTKNVYITVDLDAFDPSIMPSTGTPEPGGLGWYQALALLRAVMEQRHCVGFDVVELCPNGAPHAEYLAAKLVYKLIAYHASESARPERIA
ncbi:MAG: agmatinase [Spirochaetales bacterium]|nr:agmatinase [Spirochaetales bacterium]